MTDPLLHEARIAIAFAWHLRPAGELANGGEQQPVSQMGGVIFVLLKSRVGDFLVVRVVLELARDQSDGRHEFPAIGA